MADGVIAAGKMAPNFKLPASDGTTVELSDLRGKTVVLYFYPKADTPGCTKEACSFRDRLADYNKEKTVILGVSPDPIEKVKKFANKFHLNFPLLADADRAVCEKYSVWGQKSFMGRKYMGALRTTFVIDKAGKIAHIFENVKVKDHEKAVLKWVRENAG